MVAHPLNSSRYLATQLTVIVRKDLLVGAHIYMHTCMHTYIHTYTHTYIHAYMHACIHTYILHNIYVCIYLKVCLHNYTCTQTHMHVCTYCTCIVCLSRLLLVQTMTTALTGGAKPRKPSEQVGLSLLRSLARSRSSPPPSLSPFFPPCVCARAYACARACVWCVCVCGGGGRGDDVLSGSVSVQAAATARSDYMTTMRHSLGDRHASRSPGGGYDDCTQVGHFFRGCIHVTSSFWWRGGGRLRAW